jgi:hypothetical protein
MKMKVRSECRWEKWETTGKQFIEVFALFFQLFPSFPLFPLPYILSSGVFSTLFFDAAPASKKGRERENRTWLVCTGKWKKTAVFAVTY